MFCHCRILIEKYRKVIHKLYDLFLYDSLKSSIGKLWYNKTNILFAYFRPVAFIEQKENANIDNLRIVFFLVDKATGPKICKKVFVFVVFWCVYEIGL